MPKSHDITPRWLDLRRASAYCSMHRQTLMRHRARWGNLRQTRRRKMVRRREQHRFLHDVFDGFDCHEVQEAVNCLAG